MPFHREKSLPMSIKVVVVVVVVVVVAKVAHLVPACSIIMSVPLKQELENINQSLSEWLRMLCILLVLG